MSVELSRLRARRACTIVGEMLEFEVWSRSCES